MKNAYKSLALFVAFFLLLAGEAFAQAPEAFKYQAVVRNADNSPVVEQPVGIRMSIILGPPTNLIVYQELHFPTTSAIGLISLNVGEGTSLSGTFADINWGDGSYSLQVEVDVNGGTVFQPLGSSQLLSVPYALFAKESGLWRLEADGIAPNPATLPIKVQTIVGTGAQGLTIVGAPDREEAITVAPNGRVTFAEEVGINQSFSFVDLNVRNQAGNSTVFQVEDTSGVDLFEVGRNGNVGINEITNNVTLQVQNKTQGTNNIIANFEKADGGNVLQVQADNDVVVTGNFSVTGSKNFVLDHPLDPANKLLYHNAVESPDHVTYYDGTVRLDAEGKAVVQLPTYFEALNRDYNYQLTCVGGFAQVYIATEIASNQFTIAGGRAGMKVSWQVSARRNDPWARDHPYQAEEVKDLIDKGKYYYPEGYGKGKALQIGMDDSSAEEGTDEEVKEEKE